MKNWKKALALALCALMTASVIAGCGNNTPAQTSSNATDSATDTSSAAPQEEHTEIRLTRCLYFGDVSEYQELKDEWPKMMKEKYGVDIKVNALARNEYIQKVNLLITSSSVDGIVSMFGSSDVWGYREQGVIDPIDQYMKDNENWNKLPQIMREQYKKDDGTWALPAGYTQNLFTRTIRQDWLDNLGLSVPTNTDEL